MRNNNFKLTTLAASLLLASGALMADDQEARAIAERLVDEHFQNSTLSREEQIEELLWFAGRLCQMPSGHIAERGTHAELLARGGKYAELWEKQQLEQEVEETT